MLEKQDGIDRREFTLQAALAILAGCTITVAEGCGSSYSAPSPTPTPIGAPTDLTGAISGVNGVVNPDVIIRNNIVKNIGEFAIYVSANSTGGVKDANSSISANHGHSAVITSAEFTAGSAIALDIRGSATHTHTVQISQADLTSLKNKQAVSRDSTNNSDHMHTVTFTPA